MPPIDPCSLLWPNHPTRPVDWRLQRAMHLAAAGDPHGSPDPLIQALAALLQHAAGVPSLAQVNQDVRAAQQLRLFAPDRCTEIEARLLARQTGDEIADEMMLDVELIRAYAACVFDISDRLYASGYILLAAILARGTVSAPARPAEAFLRWLGYFGGPVVLEAALPYFAQFSIWIEERGMEQSPVIPHTEAERLVFRLRAVCQLWAYSMDSHFLPVPTAAREPRPSYPLDYDLLSPQLRQDTQQPATTAAVWPAEDAQSAASSVKQPDAFSELVLLLDWQRGMKRLLEQEVMETLHPDAHSKAVEELVLAS